MRHHAIGTAVVIAALLSRLFRSGPGAELRAAQRGDAAAIGRLYDAHVDGLYAFVFHRVARDATLAEDVVQDTFAIALSRRAEYDAARGSVGSWLTVLSRNVIRDQLRAHHRAGELQATWERIDATLAQTFAAMAERPLPGEVLERAETRDLVHMAVANLPEHYRTALTRKYVDGESLEAVAVELQHGRLAEALADLEAAQDAGADDAVGIATVRAELTQIIEVARQLAMQSAGAAREQAVAHALRWGDRWRTIDPGNTEIDRRLGELMLAIGDAAGAWRQLSSTIERDPWSGAGYAVVADAFERQGKIIDALVFWQQAIVIDQTDPTPRLRKAQALIALGRTAEGDALLAEIANHTWHDIWRGVVDQARGLLERGKQPRR